MLSLVALFILSLVLPICATTPATDGADQALSSLSSILDHPADSTLYSQRVDSLMSAISDDASIYAVVYQKASETVGDYNSPSHNEEMLIPFLRHASSSGILGEAETLRARYRLEIAMKNRPGSIIPDFTFTRRDGTGSSIHQFISGLEESGKKILLIFYDPDCDHCMQVFSDLQQSPITDGCAIIAIDAEEDREMWDNTKNSLPASWAVGFAEDPIQDDETFVFPTMPSIYLLSPSGVILLKEPSLSDLETSII